MSKEKFTQLPWRIEEFRDFISIMAGYSEICYIDGDLNCDNVQANARLIAAAPEMYELLALLDNYYAVRGESNRVTKTISQVLKKVRGE